MIYWITPPLEERRSFQFSIFINNSALNISLCRVDRGSESFPRFSHSPTLVTSVLTSAPSGQFKHPFLLADPQALEEKKGRQGHRLVPRKCMFSGSTQPLL